MDSWEADIPPVRGPLGGPSFGRSSREQLADLDPSETLLGEVVVEDSGGRMIALRVYLEQRTSGSQRGVIRAAAYRNTPVAPRENLERWSGVRRASDVYDMCRVAQAWFDETLAGEGFPRRRPDQRLFQEDIHGQASTAGGSRSAWARPVAVGQQRFAYAGKSERSAAANGTADGR
jgi:hypothetical protein